MSLIYWWRMMGWGTEGTQSRLGRIVGDISVDTWVNLAFFGSTFLSRLLLLVPARLGSSLVPPPASPGAVWRPPEHHGYGLGNLLHCSPISTLDFCIGLSVWLDEKCQEGPSIPRQHCLSPKSTEV